MGFTFGFEVFGTMFLVVFLLMIALFLVLLVQALRQWHSNNQAPRLTVDALVTGKRESVSTTQHANAGDATGAHGYTTTSSTTYYVTFQVESGDRMELVVSGRDYGQLAQGDVGRLTFQGTRYLGFVRA